ncbi:MAG: hypothetical protein PHS82_03525 [Lachnospiraceae bacterium]|nr:hypothetical protein [Lachnospiraceae bacterium]
MSGYRLCQTKRAEIPYYIENISANIYAWEELCYYIHHNIYLLDSTIINEELCDWIRDELDLKQLYQKLYKVLEENQSLGDFILPIFKVNNYLTHEEFRELNNQLVRLEEQPSVVRQKLKGDYLVEHKKYINAIKVYRQALVDVKDTNLGGQFIGGVYHNMGCAYMRMFLYEEALDCFRKTYEQVLTPAALKTYLSAYAVTKPQEKYQQKLEDLQVEERLRTEIREELEQARIQVPEGDSEEDIRALLDNLTREYHNSTGL